MASKNYNKKIEEFREERSRRENVLSGKTTSPALAQLQRRYLTEYLPAQASSWAKSLNDFQKKISADAQARSKGYQSQESLKAYQDSVNEQIANLKASSKYAQEYARLSGDRNYIKSITDSLGYLDNVTKSLQDEQKYWSTWANEDAYKASPNYYVNEYADAAKQYNGGALFSTGLATAGQNVAPNRDIYEAIMGAKQGSFGDTLMMQGGSGYYYLNKSSAVSAINKEEADMYWYLLDNVSKEEADKYYKSISAHLAERAALENSESLMKIAGDNQFLKDTLATLYSVPSGFSSALTGIGNAILLPFGKTVDPDVAGKTHRYNREQLSDVGGVIADLGHTTGNMLPSIAASSVSGSPLLGAGITAMSSGGNAYAEALEQGYTREQATLYGIANGVVEGGLQYALGGIGKLGGKGWDKLASTKLGKALGGKLSSFVSNIKSGIGRAALQMGGEFLKSAGQEGFEEGLQAIIDPLLRSGLLEENLNIDWNEVGYSAMLGAMSAGLWEGGSIVSNSVQANTIGKKAFENGSWQGALDYALALDPNSKPYQLAKALQDGSIKADGNNIGNLYSALVEYMQESSKLVRKGKMTTDQYVSGQSALQQIYEARSKAEAENNASADISPNIMSASLYQEIKGLGLDEKTATKYSNAIANLKEGTEVRDKLTNELISGNSPVKNIVARELGIDATNKTAAELRNAVKSYVDTVKSQPKTEAAEQTAPKTEKELQYEQAKAATAEISKVLGEKGQAVYNEFSEGMRTGDSLMYFNNAVFDFYNQGVEASLKKNPPKKYTDIARYEGIAPIIKQRAFEAGKLDNATKAEAVKKTTEKVKSDIKEIKARQKELKHVEFDIKDLAPSAGKWTVDEDVDVDNLKGKQNAAFNYLKAVSEVSGINVHIMSGVNKSGELTAENGFYDSNTNTVYVSINAGAQSLTDITNTAVLKTASHEITHYIAATDTDAYQELRDYVVETFKKEHGEDGLARRVSQLQDIYLDQINKELTYEKAIEEMVANACETMIRDSKVFSQLVRQNMTVAERLKNGLDRFIAKMDKNRDAALEGIKETSLEARLLASNADTLKKAQELWDNALKAAIKKNQTVPDSKVTNATTEVQNPNVMQNLRTMTEDYWAYRNDVVLKGLMTSQEYDKLFNSINVIMDMARKNPDILDFGADIDSNNRPFSAIKPNSDPLYKVSLDFSTLCRKRLLQQAIVNRLQAKLKRSLTATEQTQIRNELVKLRKEGKKIEVACALCYVEAARLKSPDVINDFLENRRKYAVDYFSKKNKEFNKLIAKKQGDYLASQGIKRDATKSQMGKEAAEYLDTNKPIWRQSYKPTANEEAAIKILEDMDAAELLSVQGLAKLRLANPVAYDIYISRVRTATKSKAQETNMPFKRGDTYGFVDGNGKKTKAISKKLIADMNAENGLRYQSWSDFQAMHILDNIAAVMELATRGAKMQTYTKVPDFVTLNGKTGMMINMSLLAKGNGFNADGSFAFDPIEGMPFEEMQKLRDQFPETAGNIIVAVSNDHLRALLASNDIDYVIPYHLSGLNENLRLMMSIEDWVDYTRTQGEKSNGAENANGVKMWHKAPKFSEWFDAEAAAKADDGYAFMRKAAQKYLALCEERGLVPKFDEFKNEENYWKLLIDRKMVNHKTGKIIIQQAVKPIFDENAITVAQNAIADEQAIKDFREVQDSLVEQITSGKVEISKKMTAELVAMQNAPFTSEMETESDGRMMNLRYDETEFNARRELSSALLTVAQTDAERKSLENYQKMIKTLNERERIVADRKQKLETLDKVKDAKRYAELLKEIRQQETLINNIDSRLINLEATKPLKDIVARKEARLKEQLKDTRARQLKAKFRNNIRRNIMSLDKKLRANNGQKHVLQELQPSVAQMLDIFTEDKGVFRKDRLERLHAIYVKFSPDDKSKQTNDSSADRGYSTDISEYKHTFSQIVSEKIQLLAPLLDGKRLSDLTIEELSAVNDIVSNINQMVNDAETIRVEGRRANLKDLTESSYVDMRNSGYDKTEADGVKVFFNYKNALPVNVMERLGDTVMEYLWKPLEQATYQMMREQVADTEFMQNQLRKYNAKEWQDKALTITLESGETITADVEHWMNVYALAKREASHRGLGGAQIDHLRVGGIVITTNISEQTEEKILGIIPRKKRYKSKSQGTPLTDKDIQTISDALTKEQKEYVDTTVKYLSTTVADRGNRASQDLHGIDIFTEEYYIPIIVSGNHLHQSFIGKAEKLIKNAGMTNSLTQNASNPLYVDRFSVVVAQHLLEMERYDTLAVPLDNIDRWLDYHEYEESPSGTRIKIADGKRVKTGVTTRSVLEDVYGDAMLSYLDQFFKDVNAASTRASNEGIGHWLIGRFRKDKVLSSLTVAAQQPASIARAGAYIKVKYFKPVVGNAYRNSLEQMLKYSGAAFVKEHGSFDPAVSTNAIEDMLYLDPETSIQKLKQIFSLSDPKYRDELLGKLPQIMDRVTWVHIWEAVKNETKANNPQMDVDSKEFLKMAGERFDYVINRTQVYDSVLSKSELMRSKSAWIKSATSFAAENTVSYNMIMRGVEQTALARAELKNAVTEEEIKTAKRNYSSAKKHMSAASASIFVSAFLAAFGQSLVTAARKDDPDDEDDKSYIEWFAYELVNNFLSNLNPLGLLPFVRELQSLLEGYDIDNGDMELISSLFDSIKTIFNENAPLDKKLEKIASAIGMALGIPINNILRDTKALRNVIVDIFNGWDTSWNGIGNAMQQGAADATILPIVPDATANTADKLYKAMMNGDKKAQAEYYANLEKEYNEGRAKGKYKNYSSAKSYISSQLRERLKASDDIKALYEASEASNFAEYNAIKKKLIEKGFTDSDIVLTLNNYRKAIKEQAQNPEAVAPEETEETAVYDKEHLVNAIENNKEAEVLNEWFSGLKRGTEEYKDMSARIKRYITETLKPQYQDAFLASDSNTVAAIYRRLKSYGKYGIVYDDNTIKKWRESAAEDRA